MKEPAFNSVGDLIAAKENMNVNYAIFVLKFAVRGHFSTTSKNSEIKPIQTFSQNVSKHSSK